MSFWCGKMTLLQDRLRKCGSGGQARGRDGPSRSHDSKQKLRFVLSQNERSLQLLTRVASSRLRSSESSFALCCCKESRHETAVLSFFKIALANLIVPAWKRLKQPEPERDLGIWADQVHMLPCGSSIACVHCDIRVRRVRILVG